MPMSEEDKVLVKLEEVCKEVEQLRMTLKVKEERITALEGEIGRCHSFVLRTEVKQISSGRRM